jgi:hypothetical protein
MRKIEESCERERSQLAKESLDKTRRRSNRRVTRTPGLRVSSERLSRRTRMTEFKVAAVPPMRTGRRRRLQMNQPGSEIYNTKSSANRRERTMSLVLYDRMSSLYRPRQYVDYRPGTVTERLAMNDDRIPSSFRTITVASTLVKNSSTGIPKSLLSSGSPKIDGIVKVKSAGRVYNTRR